MSYKPTSRSAGLVGCAAFAALVAALAYGFIGLVYSGGP